MNTLIECISGIDSIEPYCDASLRIIMRMADVLMYKHECKVLEIQDGMDVVEMLNYH